jgi:leucyl-tRNA synthetase
MDTFVDSSWYFLRFVSSQDDDRPFDPERASDWLPVDRYVGGIEHATMHLIYARFVTKVLADLDLLDVREPFANLLTQGMVLQDGTAMSSSTGNVVSPASFVAGYGADTARVFMLETARPETDFEWAEEGVRSTRRFLDRCYRLVDSFVDGAFETVDDRGPDADHVARETDATVATATESYEELSFVEAIRAVRDLVGLLDRYREATTPHDGTLRRGLVAATKVLAPVAPHLAEELWELLDGEGMVATDDWPAVTPDGTRNDLARRLVVRTREDVRDIVDVAGVDPGEIVVTVAPAWMHDVRERAVEAAEAGEDVVPAVMQDETLREAGEDVAGYAKELAGETRALGDVLPPAEAAEVLAGASWLLADVFDADARDERPGDAPAERLADARPGRPGIDVRESP